MIVVLKTLIVSTIIFLSFDLCKVENDDWLISIICLLLQYFSELSCTDGWFLFIYLFCLMLPHIYIYIYIYVMLLTFISFQVYFLIWFFGSSLDLLHFTASGKAAEFGQLKDGYMFESSTGLSRMWEFCFPSNSYLMFDRSF